MKQITVKFDDSLVSLMEQAAEERGSTVADVVRKAVENDLAGGLQTQILQLQIFMLGMLFTMPDGQHVDRDEVEQAAKKIARHLSVFTSIADAELEK